MLRHAYSITWLLYLTLMASTSGCATTQGSLRDLGKHLSCHEMPLSADDVEALYREGLEICEEEKMGDYHRLDSLALGLPILKRAALHGHIGAIRAYASHHVQAGIIDHTEFLEMTAAQAAAEGMLWLLVAAHLGDQMPIDDRPTFAVLLDPKAPYPAGFFEQDSGFSWLLQMFRADSMDPIRDKAFRLARCIRR